MYSSFCGAQLDLHTPPRAESREGRRVDITYTPDYALIGRDSTIQPVENVLCIMWHPTAGQVRMTSMVSLIRIEFAPCFIPSSFVHSSSHHSVMLCETEFNLVYVFFSFRRNTCVQIDHALKNRKAHFKVRRFQKQYKHNWGLHYFLNCRTVQ